MSALVLSCSVAASLGLLYIAVGVLHTLVDRRRQRHEDRFRTELADRISHAITTDLPPVRIARRWLGRDPKVLQDFAMGLAGSGVERIRRDAQQAGVSDRIRRLAGRRSWRARTRAAQLLRLLPDDDPVVPALLSDRRAEVSARALDSIGVEAVGLHIGSVLDACSAPDVATRFAAQQALLGSDERVIEPLIEAVYAAGFGTLRPEAVSAVLGACATVLNVDVAQAVADHSWSGSVEHRRLRVAVLANGLSAGAENDLVAMFQDPHGSVRAAAVEAVGRLGNPMLASALGRCLEDPVWEVRRAAGVALAGLGPAGGLILRRQLSGPDRYAADMAKEMLDRRALGQGWAA